jgi:uncharacterized protein (TIGR02145 family)
MRTIIYSCKRPPWVKTSLAFHTCLLFLTFSSCQMDEFNQDLIEREGIESSAIALDPSADLFYGPETFSPLYPPSTYTRSLANSDFEDFRMLVLNVQNGESNKTQVRILEISIDGVLILTGKDFKKGINTVSKPLSGLKANSTLEVKLYGPLKSFINIQIEGKRLIYAQVSDFDGNIYKTIQIGNQWWMAENLKTTRYNDGTFINHPEPGLDWLDINYGAYAWYNDDEITYKNAYGALYNWFAVHSGNLCPLGWHIPTDGSWKELEISLGMSQADADAQGFRGDMGGKLKSTRTAPDPQPRWVSPNTGATNESGFSGLPGGYRPRIDFQQLEGMGKWWSLSSAYGSSGLGYYMWTRELNSNSNTVGRQWSHIVSGHSVRCVKDKDIIEYVEENAQKWFGNYSVCPYPTYPTPTLRSHGAGQSFIPNQDCNMTGASVKFLNSFGQFAAIRMELRDINGNILSSTMKELDASFSGGWVRGNFDEGIKLIAGQEYILTWWLSTWEVNTEISNYSLGDQYGGFTSGRGFSGEYETGPGWIGDWTYWHEVPWDFCFKIHGE